MKIFWLLVFLRCCLASIADYLVFVFERLLIEVLIICLLIFNAHKKGLDIST